MESTLTVTDAARNFSDVINRVVYRGDTAILTRNGKPVARIIPERPKVTGRELAKIWAKRERMPKEEAEAFARDIEEGRRLYNKPEVPRDPWEKWT